MARWMCAAWALGPMLICSCTAKSQQTTAPNLRVAALDGSPIDLRALRGSVTLVDFWSSWSTPSKARLGYLQRIYSRLSPKGLRVVGVALDSTARDTSMAVRRAGVKYPNAAVGRTVSRTLAKAFQINAVPVVVVLDSKGNKVYRVVGFPKDVDQRAEYIKGLEARLRAMLAAK